jgi:hypothetical protein
MSDNPEIDKAVAQMEAQRPPVENAAEAVDKSVGVYSDPDEFHENGPNEPAPSHPSDEAAESEPEPKKAAKKAASKKTSGNRAAKTSTKAEE